MNYSNSMKYSCWMLLIILSILWGGSFFFSKIALKEFPIFSIVFLRVFFGGVILFVFALITKKKLPTDAKIWFSFLVMGLLNNVIPFSMIVSAQKYIDSGFASILNAATPFFTIIVAHFLTKDEKLTIRKIIGLIMGLSGVVILIGYNTIFSGANELIGAIAVVIAALSYAFAGVWGKRFKAYGIDPVITATGQLLCSSIILLPIILIIDRPWNITMPSFPVCFSIFGIALFSTSLAYIIYFKVLSSSGATNVLLVTLLIPVSAIFLGVFILSEEFHNQYVYGILIIGMGLAIIDGRLLHHVKGVINAKRDR